MSEQLHSISCHDTFEVAFYFLYGYRAQNIQVIPRKGALVCHFSIVGDEKLLELQTSYFKNPTVPLGDFRNMLNRVNSLIGQAKKDAQEKLKEEKQFNGGIII